MSRFFRIILSMLFIFVCTGCTIIGYDGPYEGSVIDSDTKKPIEGAVVFGEWVVESIQVLVALQVLFMIIMRQ